jgi:hypothetical protein
VELRKLFRLLTVIGALVFTVYQGATAIRHYRDLQSSMKIGDRSGADLYKLNWEIDCVEILVAWGFAGGLIYVLRPKTPRKP